MRHIITFTIALPLLAALACDSPDDEAMLEALDEEAELQDQGQAAAGAAPEFDVTAKPKPAAAGCQFKVIWPTAGVYEQPGTFVLKTKHAGDIVGHGYFCSTWYDGVHEWQPVATASAEDGIGWMRRQALVAI